MKETQFLALAAQGYNRIPVSRRVLADMDTPLSVFHKLVDGPYSYLFESVAGGEQWGRYSIIGLPARHYVTVGAGQWIEYQDGEIVESHPSADPLTEVEALHGDFRVPEIEGLPKFSGGLVGYFGYETVRFIEPRLNTDRVPPDGLGAPDIVLMISDEVAVFDNLSGFLHLIVNADSRDPDAWSRAQERLDELTACLYQQRVRVAPVQGTQRVVETDFVSGFDQQSFEAAVRRCKDYIAAGDIMQVVLSQRLSIDFKSQPLDVYRALRFLNPSPYLYFLDLDELHIVGSSPEVLVRLEGDTITVRPIAGTRPRGGTPAEDQALATELLADPKERAEHLMLMDLGRNDVGRVARVGSVEVAEQMVIERYSHVMHMVSQIQGQRRAEVRPMDVLRATLPAGTLSGAPKIRAMEIIQETEPVKRNIYGGAVGYLGWRGDMDLAIAIRTAVIHAGRLHVQVGAGIVNDSDPRREWEETMSKGRALFRAVAQAVAGMGGHDAVDD